MLRLMVFLLTFRGLKRLLLSEFVMAPSQFKELKRTVLSLNRQQLSELNEAIDATLHETIEVSSNELFDAETIASLRESVKDSISEPARTADIDKLVGIAKVDPSVWENKTDRELIEEYLMEKYLGESAD